MEEADAFGAALVRLGGLLAAWPHPAAVIGGVAIGARVLPRTTLDIDVVIAVPQGSERELREHALRHGFLQDPEQSDELLDAGLLRLHTPPSPQEGVGLDVILVDSRFLEQVVARASRVDLGLATLPVASVEDLLLLKLEANRPQDIDDILAIKDACAGFLDLAYVRAEAQRLGVSDLLALYFEP
ncbi:MAG: nucleotidyl transferase AbiEii/AbiGii toxin family protein [Deltaproteobacteria bacterium]|nr:nucleotidyl transferase AbiEii/AbiGii toxin family protein [Deltaproteobacteria bacterium]